MGFILNLLLHEPLRKTRKKKIYGKHYMEIEGQRSLGIWERFGNEESTHRHLSAYGNAKRVWDVWWAQSQKQKSVTLGKSRIVSVSIQIQTNKKKKPSNNSEFRERILLLKFRSPWGRQFGYPDHLCLVHKAYFLNSSGCYRENSEGPHQLPHKRTLVKVGETRPYSVNILTNLLSVDVW